MNFIQLICLCAVELLFRFLTSAELKGIQLKIKEKSHPSNYYFFEQHRAQNL